MNRGISALQRTMRALREQGGICAKVETFNPHVGTHGIRQDLFGICDILLLDPGRGFVGIQVCGQSFAEHYRKMTIDCAEASIAWLSTTGGYLEIWSWRKIKIARGGTAMRWAPRVVAITMDDFKTEGE